jgi:glutaconate CoA-transferase subunit A
MKPLTPDRMGMSKVTDKLVPLNEAVSHFIHDDDTVFVGGFGQCIPFATAHEIARQGRRGLTLCRSGADILFDLLIAAGCVSKVIVGYVGNPGIGLAHAFRRAVQSGAVAVEDWTNFSMVLRLHAGALGVPFLPTYTLDGGDLPAHLDVRAVVCPYTGERLSAVPALHPDVAIIHAQRADAAGNIQLFGLTGDTLEGAHASRNIMATVEEIVPSDVIHSCPDRTVLPAFRVSAVSLVPWGAYPSYVQGYYGRDDGFYEQWDDISRSEERVAEWIKSEIRDLPDFDAFLHRLDARHLHDLKSAMGGAESRG